MRVHPRAAGPHPPPHLHAWSRRGSPSVLCPPLLRPVPPAVPGGGKLLLLRGCGDWVRDLHGIHTHSSWTAHWCWNPHGWAPSKDIRGRRNPAPRAHLLWMSEGAQTKQDADRLLLRILQAGTARVLCLFTHMCVRHCCVPRASARPPAVRLDRAGVSRRTGLARVLLASTHDPLFADLVRPQPRVSQNGQEFLSFVCGVFEC